MDNVKPLTPRWYLNLCDEKITTVQDLYLNGLIGIKEHDIANTLLNELKTTVTDFANAELESQKKSW
jgi:hypothetical protein